MHNMRTKHGRDIKTQFGLYPGGFGAAGASHDSLRTPNVHISGPRRFTKTTKIQREDTQRETKRANGAGEGKKSEMLGPPTPSGPPLFLCLAPPPFPTLRGRTDCETTKTTPDLKLDWPQKMDWPQKNGLAKNGLSQRVGAPKGGAPKGETPKISLFFSPSPAAKFVLFFPLWGSSRGILVVFLKAGTLKCARLEFSTKGSAREGREKEHCRKRGKKKSAKFWPSPPPPPLRGPTASRLLFFLGFSTSGLPPGRATRTAPTRTSPIRERLDLLTSPPLPHLENKIWPNLVLANLRLAKVGNALSAPHHTHTPCTRHTNTQHMNTPTQTNTNTDTRTA